MWLQQESTATDDEMRKWITGLLLFFECTRARERGPVALRTAPKRWRRAEDLPSITKF